MGDKVYEYLSLGGIGTKGSENTHRTLLRLGEVTALRETGHWDAFISALTPYIENASTIDAFAAEGTPAVGDGIPIAHHVFCGNTNDASILPQV